MTGEVNGDTWCPDFGDTVFGDSLNLTVESIVDGKNLRGESNNVKIKGAVLDKTQVKACLQKYNYYGEVVDKFIMCRESNYQHFMSSGNPKYGPPHGFGIMQIDPPDDHGLQIWDWKLNVDEGMKRLINDKAVTAKKYLQAFDYDDDQLLKDTVSLYNGGHYYEEGIVKDGDGAPQRIEWVMV